MIYFDYNATAPLLPEARQAWNDAHDQFIGNPSSPHRAGSRAETALNLAREDLARILNCDPLDLIWTSSATESNNMVFHHIARTLGPDAEIWVSAIEHPSVIESAAFYFPQCRFIPIRSGIADLDWIQDQLNRTRPALISVMAANNETGIQQPWTEILQLCRRKEVPFYSDAVQWLGKLPAAGFGSCQFVSGSAHKFGGPKGTGFLKCPSGRFHPLLRGGNQEEGRRAGTENVPGAIAAVTALKFREKQLAEGGHILRQSWREKFELEISRRLTGLEVFGKSEPRLWNTVSVLMPPSDCRRRWVVKLDKAGFAVSTGSACASGKEQPSHVLQAMGFSPAEAGRALRFSSGWETTGEDWRALAQALMQVATAMH